MRRLRRFVSLPPADKALFAEAFLCIAAWRIGLCILPLRKLRARPSPRPAKFPRPVGRISWAVAAAARYIPRASCLTQSLALQAILSRHGHASTLHIGVARSDAGCDAHAWVECDGLILNPGQPLDRYAPLLAWKQTR